MKQNIFIRNFKVLSFIKFFFVILVISLLTSCTTRGLRKDFKEDYAFYTQIGLEECEKHGQFYVQHYSPDLETWEVLCFQKSPVRHFTYIIS